jgi:hypothetical protein
MVKRHGRYLRLGDGGSERAGWEELAEDEHRMAIIVLLTRYPMCNSHRTLHDAAVSTPLKPLCSSLALPLVPHYSCLHVATYPRSHLCLSSPASSTTP